jgi:ribonucleoside-diphosphate reductase alpha chain
VSNTVHIQDNEWEEVTQYIHKNRQYFNGITFLPEGCDKDYPQPPFSTIYTPEEILNEYGHGCIMASGLIVDGISAWSGKQVPLWDACDTLLGRNGDPNTKERKDWVRRAKQFSERYFDGDDKRMTYCLKDVHNYKEYVDLAREYKPVPWEEFFEEDDNTKIAEDVACAGGACELKKV